MKHSLITSEMCATTNWSGGTTTELFIFPENSEYKKRDFEFRISNATVEIETSSFTPLEGVFRTLMVLDGEMSLNHEGHHSKTLKKFDTDEFQGGWKTSSKGTCVDYNLMTMGNTKGELEGIYLESYQLKNFTIDSNIKFLCIYTHKGNAEIKFENTSVSLTENTTLIIQEIDTIVVTISSREFSELVITKIFH